MGKSGFADNGNLSTSCFVMEKIKKYFTSEWFWFGLIILIGAFLRLYKLEEWQYFTYDQARDYLIIKKMIVDGKLTLVGPTVSIAPGFFLPPFYYYSLAPFLWLFKFRLLGPDLYTTLFGIASIYVFYLLVKDLFNNKAALFCSFVFALNPYIIHTSRHAWNPNTIIFYILLFAFAGERYLFAKKRKYLLLVSFSLAWAISLHLTAVVFTPFLFYLFYKDIKAKKINLLNTSSLAPFVIFFLPLVVFDLRHSFQVSKAGISFLKNQSSGSPLLPELIHRGSQFFYDLLKVPIMLMTGFFLERNITVRPSDISLLSDIRLSNFSGSLDILKFALLMCAAIGLGISLKSLKKDKRVIFVFSFVTLGFLIRFLFPITYFFFYYYLSLFPFIILLLGFLFESCQRKPLLIKKLPVFSVAILSVLSLFPNFVKTDTRNEKYFSEAVKAIAKDYESGKTVAIAANPNDRGRWEKNGLEYRFFLESKYSLPLGGWEPVDYREAEVLYLIDEGNLSDPLTLKGMEMGSFGPKKIEKVWEVPTGQKIYKMVK